MLPKIIVPVTIIFPPIRMLKNLKGYKTIKPIINASNPTSISNINNDFFILVTLTQFVAHEGFVGSK